MERHLLRVGISITIIGKEQKKVDVFTGKLVKSLVIDGNLMLKRFFEKSTGCSPKLIHVTPLYVESSKVRCVHSLREVSVAGRYTFYVGFAETQMPVMPSFDDVYNALLNISGIHRFKNITLSTEILSVETMDVDTLAKRTISRLLEAGKLKVVFASPTLLRDPLKTTKHKSLTPIPMNLFSTPVYLNLYVAGKLKRATFLRTLFIFHRLFSEPHSMYKTVRVVKIRYDENKNPIPSLIGYVNLYLNRDYFKKYTARGYNIDGLLHETFTTALTLGVGTSRATGFGHITLVVPSGSSTADRVFQGSP